MSTSYYFECLAHEPGITSDEISQHDDFHVEQALKWASGAEPIPMEVYLDGSLGYFELNAVSFLLAHPRCPMRLVDEYGRMRPVLGRGEDEVRAALERDVARQHELMREASAALARATGVAAEAEGMLAVLDALPDEPEDPEPEPDFWDDRTTPGARS